MRHESVHIVPKRCAIYTRKSSEEGLEQAFNSLHAQREACEAYALSQQHEGWQVIPTLYDDGGYSGGKMERPAIQQLLSDVEAGQIDIILVYKVDRLSRSLADFVRLIERFDELNVSFVSVTQQFNTSSSMGRLTLNVLLSFAQFEREVTGERIRDKIAASKKKGHWMGGLAPLGFDAHDKQLHVNEKEAPLVNHIYQRYLALGSVRQLKHELDRDGIVSKVRVNSTGTTGGRPFSRGALYLILRNPLYVGKVSHKGTLYKGQHQAIVSSGLWEKVQKRLHENRQRKTIRANKLDPSLFTGLLYDDNHYLMSPSHTRKGQRRYRYYVSQAALQYKDSQQGSVIRVSAKQIETLVIGHLLEHLTDGLKVLELVDTLELPADKQALVIKQAQLLAAQWKSLRASQQIEIMQTIINQIIISKEALTIQIDAHHLKALLLQGGNVATIKETKNQNTHQCIKTLTLPAQLQRCGIETRLIVPNSVSLPEAHQRSIKALQEALAKALKWNQALLEGPEHSVVALSKKEQVNESYVRFILHLAYLAPDIMQAIAKGHVPTTFTLESLKKDFSLDWHTQRQQFFHPSRH